MTEVQAAKWGKKRTKGKAKYVMYWGVAAWGLGLTAVTTALEWFAMGTFTPGWFYSRLIIFSFIGFLVTNLRWESQERKFRARP